MNCEIIYDEDINQYPLELNGYKIVYHNDFEIVGLTKIDIPIVYLNEKEPFRRLIIKPIFKLSVLNGEVIDEQTKTIHKCHPFYTQTIADQIIQDKINAMKQKNHIFNNEQEEVLRAICLCLRKQNNNTEADEIEEQYLYPKSFNPLSYQEIIDKYNPLIKPHIKKQIVKQITPIYKLRNERTPQIE
jgi:hypothetical protein